MENGKCDAKTQQFEQVWHFICLVRKLWQPTMWCGHEFRLRFKLLSVSVPGCTIAGSMASRTPTATLAFKPSVIAPTDNVKLINPLCVMSVWGHQI